jgi:hypothetical protein
LGVYSPSFSDGLGTISAALFWEQVSYFFNKILADFFGKPLDGAGGLCYFIKVGGDSEFRVTGR